MYMIKLFHAKYAAFAAGVVLLFNLWASKRAGTEIDQHKEIQNIWILLGVLEAQEAKSASAGRFWCDFAISPQLTC